MSKEKLPTTDASKRSIKEKFNDMKVEHRESGITPDGSKVKITSVFSVPAEDVGGPKGEKRYYKGEGESSLEVQAEFKAQKDALLKSIKNPSDSTRVKDLNIMKKK
tara:strand:+ start:300 stop:617 length:318 start_codon:yes stop_codon:yes gene_type:complete